MPIGAKASSSHVDHVIKTSELKVLAVDQAHLDQAVSLVKGTDIQLLLLSGSDAVNQDVIQWKDLIAKGKSASVEAVRPGM